MKPTWRRGAFSDLDDNVRKSIAGIQASPFVPHKVAVRGLVSTSPRVSGRSKPPNEAGSVHEGG